MATFLHTIRAMEYPVTHFAPFSCLNPDSAVEKSGERNLGRYEKWDGGNDFVGMAWSLVGKRPFQLRRNRKSVLHRAQATQELGPIGLWHRKTDLYPAPLRDQISAHQKHEVSNRSQPSFKPRARQHRLAKIRQ